MDRSTFYVFILSVIISLFLGSCADSSNEEWSTAVPQETSFVIVPAEDATIQTVLQSEYMPFLEDISSSTVQMIAEIDSSATPSLQVHSILLNPDTEQKLQPVWITEAPEDFREKLRDKYTRNFRQNEYSFHDISILNLILEDRSFFVARLGKNLALSESSISIENTIRAYKNITPRAKLNELDIVPGSIIVNTPSLDRWVAQLGRVNFHPQIENVFKGGEPGLFTIQSRENGEENEWQLTGDIPLSGDSTSALIRSISYENGPVTLPDYVSSNAAAFGIFHAPPPDLPESVSDTSAADAFLINNPDSYNDIAETLGTEFGMVMYTESGFLSTGEHLFLRKLEDPQGFRSQLRNLAQQNLISESEGIYTVQSTTLAKMLGSDLCNFTNFYVNVVDDAVVISKRKGLADLVASDKNRRRVISYEDFYKEMAVTFPDQLSGLFVAGPEFNSFLTPYLASNNYLSAITSTFNHLTLTTRVNDEGNRIAINLSTFNRKEGAQPFQENWFYDIGGAQLSGPPAFGNIGGNYHDEVVFATETGTVYALATDGTVVQQFNTGRDEPIGSPVIYDWYGSGQNVVLIAAGNKIYGWDENGELLPKFPFELNETITTPLTIADINNNRLPDAVVATADRRLHVLNGRGVNLDGWPVTTNAPVNSAPLAGYYQDISSVIAFSSNAVHAWEASGDLLSGFPKFIDASFRGSPVKYEEMVLGTAVNGNLYGIGDDVTFADSLNTYNTDSDNGTIKSIDVSGSALTGTPDISENYILATGRNGAVFLINPNGELQLTKNMGQPTAPDWPAHIIDINGDGNKDIVALASYGRLYAWQIGNGERLFDLPKAGMSSVSIGDLDNDGLMEVVAQTEEGIRSWTVNR